MRHARALVATLFWVAAALGRDALAGELVVIDSSPGTLTPGVIVDGGKTLSLPTGASVTLVAQSGAVIQLEGPYQGRPDVSNDERDPALLESLSRIVRSQDDKASSLAAFRAIVDERPDVWAIDVERGGVYCVRENRPTQLARKGASERVTLVMTRVDRESKSVNVSLAAGKRTAAWPIPLALVDGALYSVRYREKDFGEVLQIRLVPETSPSDLHRAAWMADHGCMRQARRLVERVARRGE